jgi:hypothetical protein
MSLNGRKAPYSADVIELIYSASNRKRDFNGEAQEILHELCDLTGSDYGGFYVVKLLPLGNTVTLLESALGGPAADKQTDFSSWLTSVRRSSDESNNLGNDDMVKRMRGELLDDAVQLKIVRGDILPHNAFGPGHRIFEQRKKEGIAEVTDIEVGHYGTGFPGERIAACLYRLRSRRRYKRSELNRLGTAVHKHAERYCTGDANWSWRWWHILDETEWNVWTLIATKGLTDAQIATGMSAIAKKQNPVLGLRFTEDGIGNVVRRLFKKLKVQSRPQLVRLFFNPRALLWPCRT